MIRSVFHWWMCPWHSQRPAIHSKHRRWAVPFFTRRCRRWVGKFATQRPWRQAEWYEDKRKMCQNKERIFFLFKDVMVECQFYAFLISNVCSMFPCMILQGLIKDVHIISYSYSYRIVSYGHIILYHVSVSYIKSKQINIIQIKSNHVNDCFDNYAHLLAFVFACGWGTWKKIIVANCFGWPQLQLFARRPKGFDGARSTNHRSFSDIHLPSENWWKS